MVLLSSQFEEEEEESETQNQSECAAVQTTTASVTHACAKESQRSHNAAGLRLCVIL